jgi:hypothetical protein
MSNFIDGKRVCRQHDQVGEFAGLQRASVLFREAWSDGIIDKQKSGRAFAASALQSTG